jgi:hypothetical protein
MGVSVSASDEMQEDVEKKCSFVAERREKR